jgi:hypothetical protein
MAGEMANLFKIEGRLLLGYTTMLVAFSLIFVAVKNSRDKYGDGTITFGKAFKIGLIVTLIASTIYVVVWLIDYNYFGAGDYLEKYYAHQIAKMKAAGAKPQEISKAAADGQNFIKSYKNPLVNAAYTYMEILPVGLVVSLVAAVILKRKTTTGSVVLTN